MVETPRTPEEDKIEQNLQRTFDSIENLSVSSIVVLSVSNLLKEIKVPEAKLGSLVSRIQQFLGGRFKHSRFSMEHLEHSISCVLREAEVKEFTGKTFIIALEKEVRHQAKEILA